MIKPYSPYVGPLLPYQNVRAINFNTINRDPVMDSGVEKIRYSSEVWYNAGVRIHNWEVTGADVSGSAQTTFSPRAQFAIKPDWEKDMVFRVSGGLYHQPPFYRELRDAAGYSQM
jgi:hypothetical protein